MPIKKRVLITGGASGIGAAIVRRSIEDGYEPVIIDRSGDGIIADLSKPDETEKALEAALLAGPITRLVNNVGIVCPADAENQTLAELNLALSLNLRCAIQCMQALLQSMNGRRI